jgi:hypothetical protein
MTDEIGTRSEGASTCASSDGKSVAPGAPTKERITFPTFDAFADFLYKRLAADFGDAAAPTVYSNVKMSGMFNQFYDRPERWNDDQVDAMRLIIFLQVKQSKTQLADLFNALLR